MSESEKQAEFKEKKKTKIIHFEYGEYADQEHEILEVPEDWNLDNLLEEYKKEKNLGQYLESPWDFIEWLVERGAKKDVAEEFYIQ